MSNLAPEPALSVVVVAASGAEATAQTLWHLHRQTVRHLLEVIIVTSAPAGFEHIEFGAEEFHAVRFVPMPTIEERGVAAAAGIAAARARVVGLLEDHSFPEPGWAEALLRAHDGPWAAVGPTVSNANGESALSWANFMLTYDAFAGTQVAGERKLLPWHNSAYKRELLTAFGGELGALLNWEGELQETLLSQGHRLYLEPAARTHHANVSRLSSTIGLQLQRGRVLGAIRARREGWSRVRCLLYACAFPLYPVMQLRRVMSAIRRSHLPWHMQLRIVGALIPTLIAMAIGEARGVLHGAGNTSHRLETYELHRLAHISRRERQQIMDFARAHHRQTTTPPRAASSQ